MRVSLNSNKTLVEKIRTKIKERGGHCPCRVQKNDDTMCMCKEFREQIDRREPGVCHCGLYVITIDEED